MTDLFDLVARERATGSKIKITHVRYINDEAYVGFVMRVVVKNSSGKTSYEFTEQGDLV